MTERSTAVGPRESVPCAGLMPSERGTPALRPSGSAPTARPYGVLEETESVPMDMRPPLGKV